MSRKYEAHITMPREQSEAVQLHAQLLGMTFSAIDGDPVMGKQAYCYLTCYETNADEMRARIASAARLLEQGGITVLREKIEEIIYDSKTGHDIKTVLTPEVWRKFIDWEDERPTDFLTHAMVARSQYDAQYRSMAEEILLLRVAVKSLTE